MSNIATITSTGLIVLVDGRALVSVARPTSLAAADEELAVASLGRDSEWDLSVDGVQATVSPIDNRFNGTVAARLWDAVGTTHELLSLVPARDLNPGDIITDSERSVLYVVAGCSWESDAMTVHMVAEGKTWEDRYTSSFSSVVTAAVRRV